MLLGNQQLNLISLLNIFRWIKILMKKINLDCFRIKAAQKHDLYDTAEGISALCRVTVEDVRNIWLYRLISETGLPSHRVTIPREIVLDMDRVVSEKIPRDKDGCIQFEHFLPTIVNLIR